VPGGVNVKDARIMIVDDSPFSVALIEKMLQTNGLNVVAKATNKTDMINKFTEEKPDFITMDLTMPEINGFDSIKLLRTIDPNFKSIMISSLKDEDLTEESKKLKINGYVQKPVKEDELINTIKNIINFDKNYLELLDEHQAVFQESFVDAVNSMTRTRVSFKEKKEEEIKFSMGFAVAIGIIGTFPGRFFLDMSNKTLTAFTRSITGEESNSSEEKAHFISEFANIVAGNACSLLNLTDKNYKFRLSSPTVFYGEELTVSTANLKTFMIVAETEFGEIIIGTSFSRGE